MLSTELMISEMFLKHIVKEILPILFKSPKEIVGLTTSGIDDRNDETTIKLSDYSVVGDFVTFNAGLKDEIQQTKEYIDEYISRQKPKRPLNILISAPSGSGKSFLVEQLSKQITNSNKIVIEEFQLAAMRNVDGIYEIFRKIQSANLEGNTPIIFLDEADAEIRGEYFYPLLLAPMADGKYYYSNSINYLGKAILFYAGSKHFVPDSNSSSSGEFYRTIFKSKFAYKQWRSSQENVLINMLKESKAPKINDFVDRTDIIIFMPSLQTELLDSDSGSEALALAISLINKNFKANDIKKIEKSAAYSIASLLLGSTTKRKADSAVFMSKVHNDNTFMFRNLPEPIRNGFESKMSNLMGKYFVLNR